MNLYGAAPIGSEWFCVDCVTPPRMFRVTVCGHMDDTNDNTVISVASSEFVDGAWTDASLQVLNTAIYGERWFETPAQAIDNAMVRIYAVVTETEQVLQQMQARISAANNAGAQLDAWRAAFPPPAHTLTTRRLTIGANKEG